MLSHAPIQIPYSFRRHTMRIPWRIQEKAWKQYAALGHGDQSAERIAERGGFGLEELIFLLAGENPFGKDWEPLLTEQKP